MVNLDFDMFGFVVVVFFVGVFVVFEKIKLVFWSCNIIIEDGMDVNLCCGISERVDKVVYVIDSGCVGFDSVIVWVYGGSEGVFFVESFYVGILDFFKVFF